MPCGHTDVTDSMPSVSRSTATRSGTACSRSWPTRIQSWIMNIGFATIDCRGWSIHGTPRGCRAPGSRFSGRFIRSAPRGPDPRMKTMPIARDDVAHLARLSRLALADSELDHLAPQLDQIIAAVARVQEVAAEGIRPTSHAVPLVNVFREDTVVPCLDAETVLSQAPAVEQQRF